MKAASYFIERNNGFLPLVLYVQADGQLAFADFQGQDELDKPPEALDYLALAQAALRPLARDGAIQATALVCDVRIKTAADQPTTDAIRVDLEHSDGASISFFQTYSVQAGEIVHGTTLCQAQQAAIFGRHDETARYAEAHNPEEDGHDHG